MNDLYETVSVGTNKRVGDHFDRKIQLLKAEIAALEAGKAHALRQLEVDCLKEHGSHEDNGDMFHGFCTRCGVYLG